MTRIVITGAAGFIGSHLAEALLDRGYTVVGIDNLLTGDTANIAHLAQPRLHVHQARRHQLHLRRRPGRLRAALGQPGQPDRLPRAADSDAEGRRARHAQGARPGQGQGRALRARLDLRGLRRSARASAEGNLLGQRQPDRPARRLRRSQALRRGDDDGLSPLSTASTRRSSASSTPTARGCASTTAAPCRRSCPGAAQRGRHGLRRRLADAQLLLRHRPGRRHHPADACRTRTIRSTSATRAR